MRRATFIVLDGVDGAGKDVQTERLVATCRKRGFSTEQLKFPVYDSFTGRDIVAYQSGEFGELDALNPRLVAYLYAANRVEARPTIERALTNSDVIIASRYAPSNVAYSAARVAPSERVAHRQWVRQLDHNVLGNPREDAVIFLDLPTDLSEQLIAKRDLGRRDIHDENRAYPEIVREQYHALAKTEPHWTVVDCSVQGQEIRTIDDIAAEIETIVFGTIIKSALVKRVEA